MNVVKDLYARVRGVVGADGLILVGVVIVLVLLAASLCTKEGDEDAEEAGWKYLADRVHSQTI